MKKLSCIAGMLAVTVAQFTHAGTEPYFNPLTQSTAVATPNHVNELNSPWQVPAGISQVNLTSMSEIEKDIDQSVVRVPGLSSGASMWDMIAFGKEGKYIFIPHETANGAGGSRYNIEADKNEVMFKGDATAERNVNDARWENDFGAFDPATLTPYGTVLFGEEWSGQGRIIEVLNPYVENVANIKIKEKESIANVSQEGLRFSKKYKNILYYVDEDRSGSIYKCVSRDYRFNKCQTFVLSVEDFAGDASKNYNDAANVGQPRTGNAVWVALTDRYGKPLTNVDPFENDANSGARPGRLAADEVGATPYGRPEDIEVGMLANGREVVYFTATSESAVYSIEITGRAKAKVRLFASEDNTPKNVGFPATTGTLASPDNLAQDAFGNIYIIEDKPNGDNVGGDIWFVRDTNGDGEAESLDHFMSVQVDGAEATGMIFNPVKPTQFVVSVQHPDSTNLVNVPEGFGDALWSFDISDVVPPVCSKDSDSYRHHRAHYGNYQLKTCSKIGDFNFVRKLKRLVGKYNK
jgi:hypothetical protein